MLMRCLECLFPRIAAPLGAGCSRRSPTQASLLPSGAGAMVFLKGHPARRRWHGKGLPSQTTKANSFPGKLQMKWEHWKHEGEKDVRNQLMSLENLCQFCWGPKTHGQRFLSRASVVGQEEEGSVRVARTTGCHFRLHHEPKAKSKNNKQVKVRSKPRRKHSQTS